MTYKAKCKCGKLAVWLYMPSNEMNPGDDMCCDDCVPRGCSCNSYPVDDNWENDNPDNWEQETDNQGRLLPCCEWWYDEEGIDLEGENPEKWSEYDHLEED